MWSGESATGRYVFNAQFLVQSNDRSPRYLDGRVEAFLAGFREVRNSFLFYFIIFLIIEPSTLHFVPCIILIQCS